LFRFFFRVIFELCFATVMQQRANKPVLWCRKVKFKILIPRRIESLILFRSHAEFVSHGRAQLGLCVGETQGNYLLIWKSAGRRMNNRGRMQRRGCRDHLSVFRYPLTKRSREPLRSPLPAASSHGQSPVPESGLHTADQRTARLAPAICASQQALRGVHFGNELIRPKSAGSGYRSEGSRLVPYCDPEFMSEKCGGNIIVRLSSPNFHCFCFVQWHAQAV